MLKTSSTWILLSWILGVKFPELMQKRCRFPINLLALSSVCMIKGGFTRLQTKNCVKHNKTRLRDFHLARIYNIYSLYIDSVIHVWKIFIFAMRFCKKVHLFYWQCCQNESSPVWLALRVNKQLKGFAAARLGRMEKLVHRYVTQMPYLWSCSPQVWPR